MKNSSEKGSRKRKRVELFEPLSNMEDASLRRALHASLRPIPSDPQISEDEIEDEEETLERFADYESEEEIKEEIKEESDRQPEWTKKSQEIKVNFYTGPLGSTKNLPPSAGVKSFFDLVFSRKVWVLLQKQTNLYAAQQILIKPDPTWKKVTIGELKAWVGCVIAMGIDKKPNLHMYWEETWKTPIITNRFTRDRFLQIRKYLHLTDNEAIAERKDDRLAKIRPLFDALVENFQKQYRPSTYLTLDEDMCKFKGRNRMKQYMAKKIVKWGYRVWKLCDAKTAYTLNFDVYTGAEDGKATSNLAANVAMRLTEPYQGKNYVVIMDNYFSSVPLFLDLLNTSTYACGTIRSQRKYLPESFREKKKRNQGESEFWTCNNLVATIWQDRRPVHLLSTCSKATGPDTVRRKSKSGEALVIPCPPSVKLYTEYMGGVDRSDRMIRTYSTSRRSKKWWLRLFYYCLDTAVVNSYILYQHSGKPTHLPYLQYVEQLALDLIGTTSQVTRSRQSVPKRKKGRRSHPRPVAGEHWPKKIAQQQRCRYCLPRGKKRVRTLYICEGCDVPLCIENCFKFYHTRS
jgi:hypothetical protein